MGAHVLLNLLNELRKSDKKHGGFQTNAMHPHRETTTYQINTL